jgi:hypothetical protein
MLDGGINKAGGSILSTQRLKQKPSHPLLRRAGLNVSIGNLRQQASQMLKQIMMEHLALILSSVVGNLVLLLYNCLNSPSLLFSHMCFPSRDYIVAVKSSSPQLPTRLTLTWQPTVMISHNLDKRKPWKPSKEAKCSRLMPWCSSSALDPLLLPVLP